MTHPYQPAWPPPAAQPPERPNRWLRVSAVGVAALVLVAAGVGVGMAATTTDSDMSSPMNTPGTASPNPAAHGKKAHGQHGTGPGSNGTRGRPQVDPARAAWSHKYGVDRSTMPNLAPAGSASTAQQAAATVLLERTETATARYSDLATAKAAGYDLAASLARKEKKTPRFAAQMKRVDSGAVMTGGHMPMLHVGNKAKKTDGQVLDPNAPETLMYSYQGHGTWKLIGVMYTATECYPQAPPDPGGPITRWHYHDKSGARGLMMHIFFVPGNDLAHAYAAAMT